MFDLSALDIVTPSEQGRIWHPTHPRTGEPFKDAVGTKLGFTFYGRHAAMAREALRIMQDERAVKEQEGQRVSEADAERLQAEYLARCTKAWTGLMLDREELPCTFQNAVKLWADPRFRWLRGPAQSFIADDGGFLPG